MEGTGSARRWKLSRGTPEPAKRRAGFKRSQQRAGGISNQVGALCVPRRWKLAREDLSWTGSILEAHARSLLTRLPWHDSAFRKLVLQEVY